MPELDKSEMATLARRWSRGSRAFKKLYEEGPVDPQTGVPHYTKKELEDPELQAMSDMCNVDRYVEFMNTTATPKDARAAKFNIIICLGQKIMAKEEAARIVAMAKPREEVKAVV